MNSYVADFETSKQDNDTWLWAWGSCEIGNVEKFEYGNTLDDFMAWCQKGKTNKTVYFHNLRFDGEFIFHWLLINGYTHSPKKKNDKTFSCIISTQNQYYQIEVIFKKMNKKYKKVTFLDSHKKLPMSVARVAKSFGLPMLKGDIDHNIIRQPNHEITVEELDYLRRDVQIVAMALGIQIEQGLDRMTIGSDAMNHFKAGLAGGDLKRGKKLFERYFPTPPLNLYTQLKQSYKGGFTWANPKWIGKDIGEGIVLDINSMYPWAMRFKELPYSMPLPFQGKYQPDDQYPLFIQRIFCQFKLKENFIPTIQIKDNPRYMGEYTLYRESHIDKLGGDDPVELTLTNVDLDLFMEHYDVIIHEYIDGYKFKACQGMFNNYIEFWMGVKVKADEDGNQGMRTLAKLMLNNLYGKFGTNPDVTGRHPRLEEDGSVKLVDNDAEFTDASYVPMAAFITSWCRDNIIRSAQKVYDRFLYADTDSLHLIGTKLPDLDMHHTKLGAWDHESTFTRARFLRAKTYIEDICYKMVDGKKKSAGIDDYEFTEMKVTCAGMPDYLHKYVTWDNFHPVDERMSLPARDGYYWGKLYMNHVNGGQILVEGAYEIKGPKVSEPVDFEKLQHQLLKELDYDPIKEAVNLHGFIQCLVVGDRHYGEYQHFSRSVKRKYFRQDGVPIDVFADMVGLGIDDLLDKFHRL